MLIVQKFGGSSVANPKAIKKIAQKIKDYKNNNIDIIAVISAMGNTTDNLTKLAKEVSKKIVKREMDMLLTCGERISMSLLSIALNDLGIASESFTGSQSGIITNSTHLNANITDVRANRVLNSVESKKVPVIAGFQGVSDKNKEITTLGRGGSDITATALASELNAHICEIWTDVDGFFDSDPNINIDAKKYSYLSYSYAYELCKKGASVLHPKAIKFLENKNIPIHIRSSFSNNFGTIIGGISGNEYLTGPNKKTKITHKSNCKYKF